MRLILKIDVENDSQFRYRPFCHIGKEADDMHMGSGLTGIDTLRSSEKLVIWAIRIWRTNHLRGAESRDILSGAFDDFGVSDAGSDLDRLMTALCNADRRMPRFDAPCAATLTLDEGRILSALALLQRGEILLAMDVMSGWMSPGLARLAVTPAFSTAEIFARNGLMLRSDAAPGLANWVSTRSTVH